MNDAWRLAHAGALIANTMPTYRGATSQPATNTATDLLLETR